MKQTNLAVGTAIIIAGGIGVAALSYFYPVAADVVLYALIVVAAAQNRTA